MRSLYTERRYRGYLITHLHGTLTFKVYDDDGELIECKSTLKDTKKAIDRLIKEA